MWFRIRSRAAMRWFRTDLATAVFERPFPAPHLHSQRGVSRGFWGPEFTCLPTTPPQRAEPTPNSAADLWRPLHSSLHVACPLISRHRLRQGTRSLHAENIHMGQNPVTEGAGV